MKYSELKYLLEELENKVSSPGKNARPRGVRKNKSPVQAFALHRPEGDHDEARDLPVVIAVGANYAQDKVSVPHPKVEDDLSRWKTNFRKGIAVCNVNKASKIKWIVRNTASPKISLPEDFHFVMTNFSLWITCADWQETPENQRANLLSEAPPHERFVTSAPDLAAYFQENKTHGLNWETSDILRTYALNAMTYYLSTSGLDVPHLDALEHALKKEETLWVGHGIGSEVFALFRLWIQKRAIGNWLLLPNLSRAYNYQKHQYPR
jgi:hypothetical protein